MTKRNVILENTLSFDPLDTAEKILGGGNRGTASHDAVMAAGLLLMQANAQAKRDQLASLGDTYSGMGPEDMKRILIDMGMVEVYSCDIAPRNDSKPGDRFYIYAGSGLLACFDTYYGGTVVNGGNIYYNWKPSDEIREKGYWSLTSSGSGVFENNDWRDEKSQLLCWSGHHDIREGVSYRIDQLRENGEILEKWIKPEFLWPFHWGEVAMSNTDPRPDYDAMRKARIAELPEWVQEMIKGQFSED
jgi:hypothetical protein